MGCSGKGKVLAELELNQESRIHLESLLKERKQFSVQALHHAITMLHLLSANSYTHLLSKYRSSTIPTLAMRHFICSAVQTGNQN